MIRPCYSGSKRARFIRFFFNYSFADYLNFTSLFMQSDRVFVLESVSLEFPRLSRGSRFVPPYNGLPLQDYTRGIYTGWPRTFQLLTASLSFLSPRWKCCRAKWRALRWSKNSFHPAENASYTLVRQRTTRILVGLLVGRTRKMRRHDNCIASSWSMAMRGEDRPWTRINWSTIDFCRMREVYPANLCS